MDGTLNISVYNYTARQSTQKYVLHLHLPCENQVHTCNVNHIDMYLCVRRIVFDVLHCPAECLCELFDSRAHTIVTVAFTQNRRKINTSMQSIINLVDLAGR